MIQDLILTSIAAFSAFAIFYLAGKGAVLAVTPLNAFGGVLFLLGGAIWLWAAITLGRYLTPGTEPKSPVLITTGPFSIVRHPIYLGASLLFLGAVLVSRDLKTIPFLSAIIYVEIVKARREEEELAKRFPAFGDYKKKVGFLVPRL